MKKKNMEFKIIWKKWAKKKENAWKTWKIKIRKIKWKGKSMEQENWNNYIGITRKIKLNQTIVFWNYG